MSGNSRRIVNLVVLAALLALTGGWRVAAQPPVSQEQTSAREFLSPASHLGGAAQALRLLEDNYAALALGLDLLILDVLGPYQPQQVARLSYPAPVMDLEVVNRTAYLLSGGRVHLVDLSDPARPRKGAVLAVEHVNDLAMAGEYLVVAGRSAEVYSLANPAAPRLLGSYTPQGSSCDEYDPFCTSAGPVLHAAAAFPYLYLRTRYYECIWYCFPYHASEIIDISDPANPLELDWPAGSSRMYVHELLALPDYWLVFGSDEIRVVAPEGLPSLAPMAVLPYAALGMALQGDRLYLAAGEAGLQIVDVSDPLAAQLLGRESTLTDARQVSVQGNLAYVAAGTQGLAVVNVREPQAPQFSGGFRSLGALSQVLLDGTTLYASSDRLEIADLSDPLQPQPLGWYELAGAPALSGSTLLLATGAQGLAALDVSDPAEPRELDRLALPGETRDVAIVGDYAYVASSAGIQVVSIGDPAALALAGEVTGVNARRIVSGADYLALTTETQLRLYDLANPAQPQQIFSYDMPNGSESGEYCAYDPGTARGLAIDGEQVYVLWDIDWVEAKICEVKTGGLVVLGRDPAGEWAVETKHGLDYGLLAVAAAEGQVYVLVSRQSYSYPQDPPGLWMGVYDAASSAELELLEQYWLPPGQLGTRQVDLALDGDLLAVADYQAGLYLMAYWQPQVLHLPALAGEAEWR